MSSKVLHLLGSSKTALSVSLFCFRNVNIIKHNIDLQFLLRLDSICMFQLFNHNIGIHVYFQKSSFLEYSILLYFSTFITLQVYYSIMAFLSYFYNETYRCIHNPCPCALWLNRHRPNFIELKFCVFNFPTAN